VIPQHHLSDDLLIGYAAGSLPEPVAVLVACHLTLCPTCRAREAEEEALSGALLSLLSGEGSPEDGLDALLARLDEPEEIPAPQVVPPQAPALLPAPLRAYIPRLDWKTVSADRMWVISLRVKVNGVTPRLIRLAGGTVVQPHHHEGTELIQVFSGGYTDRGQHHLRGDVAINRAEDDHTVHIDPGEDCIFLYVSTAPLTALTPQGERVMAFLSR
jgi:putative transcriptional regulator